VAAAAAPVGSRHGAFQVKRSDGTVADGAYACVAESEARFTLGQVIANFAG
jgi:hypothetical protein